MAQLHSFTYCPPGVALPNGQFPAANQRQPAAHQEVNLRGIGFEPGPGHSGLLPDIEGMPNQINVNAYSPSMAFQGGTVMVIEDPAAINSRKLFEFFRNDAFNARNCSRSRANPEFRRNQYGATMADRPEKRDVSLWIGKARGCAPASAIQRGSHAGPTQGFSRQRFSIRISPKTLFPKITSPPAA